ncbi:hypothetical protein K491DRAFT_721645 [Lophiostoma macrostomum CBS 122681]|uniref:RING-type domain-containing protein n=1 Tax=Lophiostoma macrostomum CBS 122681 TaxID=1314788 RepID=A0A6A6SR50_9PLEO|nr:hypothetical protein K491DRAFT_721645 [Lophiostoma macrostomum CBS 122681]
MPPLPDPRTDMNNPCLKQAFESSVRRTTPPEDQHTCIICRLEWGPKDDIVIGNKCREHVFHYECLFHWLACQTEAQNEERTCPLCKVAVVSTWPNVRPPGRSEETLIRFLIQSWVCLSLESMNLFDGSGTSGMSDRISNVFDFVLERHRNAVAANDESILDDLDVHPDVFPWYAYLLSRNDFWEHSDSDARRGLFADQGAIRVCVLDFLLGIKDNAPLLQHTLYGDIREPLENPPDNASISSTAPRGRTTRHNFVRMMSGMSPAQFLHLVELRKKFFKIYVRYHNSEETIYRSHGPTYRFDVNSVFSRKPLPSMMRLVERNQHGKITSQQRDPGYDSALFAWDGSYGPAPASSWVTRPFLMLEYKDLMLKDVEYAYFIEMHLPWSYVLSGGKLELEENDQEGIVRFVAPGRETAEFVFQLASPSDLLANK